jgi:hypothetical protein
LRLEPGGLDRLQVSEIIGIDALQVFGKFGMHDQTAAIPVTPAYEPGSITTVANGSPENPSGFLAGSQQD